MRKFLVISMVLMSFSGFAKSNESLGQHDYGGSAKSDKVCSKAQMACTTGCDRNCINTNDSNLQKEIPGATDRKNSKPAPASKS